MPSPSSSAQQALQALGKRLNELRLDARLSGRELGRLTGWHSSKVSKIEHARQTPSVDDIETWCRHCGAEDQAAELVASLRAAEGLYIEWRRMERTGLRLAQQTVVPLWDRTKQFRIYSSVLIPGPVQTPAYMTARLALIRERRDLADDVHEAVKVRLRKQAVIRDGARKFAIVLEESALRYPLDGMETMTAQLRYLLKVGSLPNVSLGIIPPDVDRSHMVPVEGFWIFDDHQVNVELISGHLIVTQARDIALYTAAFARLASLAVYGPQARSIIEAAIDAQDS